MLYSLDFELDCGHWSTFSGFGFLLKQLWIVLNVDYIIIFMFYFFFSDGIGCGFLNLCVGGNVSTIHCSRVFVCVIFIQIDVLCLILTVCFVWIVSHDFHEVGLSC